ncbi:hypothetical protein ABB37_01813 [Leptomonas pyrrhocoris]|uniref:Uncharacterized protein n=1 Tax=Leptomonas pyrrhocoris TaxID=157538 RepID=A0A0N0DZS0_LEPPY|nr:hypothetical protein ABB37_01813 [Leptomonas pyrrhocoris]KPA85542.1 hypothetical protein ABB37_01813 [Leptomonas pyrrhocoris]|eukprot:XP_015663981.1 hypothetical protein ABB37_01813 [Leptomonas pyrrhocoris]
MKRKTNPIEAAPLPTCSAIGPEDMVLVACTSGETFLIERNCALLSSHCRDTLMLWENTIRRTANLNRSDRSSVTPTITPIDSGSNGFPGSSSGGLRVLADLAETPNTTIPFMSAWDADAKDRTAAATSIEAQVQLVPIQTVAERYQQRMDGVTPSKVERPSSSKNASSHGDRKGVVVVPKSVSPLAPLEDVDGSWLYPVVQLPYVTPQLLESALAYASKKYKMDIDGDKVTGESVPPVSAIATGEQWQMMAAAVLTGI